MAKAQPPRACCALPEYARAFAGSGRGIFSTFKTQPGDASGGLGWPHVAQGEVADYNYDAIGSTLLGIKGAQVRSSPSRTVRIVVRIGSCASARAHQAGAHQAVV